MVLLKIAGGKISSSDYMPLDPYDQLAFLNLCFWHEFILTLCQAEQCTVM